ncbi:MAG: MarR family transcriptional regulator [Eubacterium sp.]|nr:MarR family transcriptional regulator [Eubacterium sp.]
MDAKKTINKMLVYTFHQILELEEKAIITEEFKDISNNDMHIIEAIGLGKGKRMSAIARELKITVGSLTTSMNSLVYKGYVARERSQTDRRVVNVYLLDKGIAAYKHHEKFHDEMTEALMSQFTEEELAVWVKALDTLTDFFESQNDIHNKK